MNVSYRTYRLGRWLLAVFLPLCFAGQRADARSGGQAAADLRALLEGTFELEEWHLNGQVLRPPQIGGRWSNHDGVVLAIYHRAGPGGFESFAGYGTYKMEGSMWAYGYARTERAAGASAAEAKVTVTENAPVSTFKVSREGGTVVLERPNDRREYDATTFTFMPNGRTLRKYRKVQ